MHSLIYELKDILRWLDRFVGHFPIYIYLVDAENTISWFNRYMAEMLPNIYVGQQLRCPNALLPCGEDCDDCKLYSPLDNRKDPRKKQISITGSNGEEIFLEFFNLPVFHKDGSILGALRIGMDVTEYEKLERKLREKEKLFSAIINTSTDAVIFLDNEDRIKSWNKGAEDIFGYREEEIIGEPLQRLVPDDLISLGELNYLRSELASQGLIKKYETQRLHKSGRSIYVDISATRIYDEAGEPIGTSESIKDIDSRKALEFELLRTILELSKLNELNEILHRTRDEREILRIILIAITAGEGLRFNRAFIMMVDEDTRTLKGHLAIGPSDQEEANRIWSELNQDYHYLKDIIQIYQIDLEGADRKVNEIVTQIEVPLDQEDHILIQSLNRKRVFQVKNGQPLGPGEFEFGIRDTDLFELLKNDTFVIAPVYSKTEPLGVIITDNCINKREISTEDIEGLKLFASQASSAIENARLYRHLEHRIQEVQEAYRQLEENQEKLVRAERLAAIGEMSAKVAHEIRNPLVSIGGFARLIERKIAEDSEIKQYAGVISEQVANLENILNNILNVANPPQPERRLVNINQILEQVLAVMEQAVVKRRISLVKSLAAQDIFIVGDKKMLYQALLNLVKNGIEALDSRLDNREMRIITRVEGGQIEIQIADNGPGIETSLLGKIFQTFFTTKSSGTGLGLPIVNQIVEAHDGRIDVKTEANRETVFSLSFPAAPEEMVNQTASDDVKKETHPAHG